MASPGYGENGSVIGPQNLPTSSVASGVWSLGEVAEAERDSIWPAPQFGYEKIATITPGTGTNTLTFSGIPSGFRHLEVIFFSSTAVTTYFGPNLYMTNNISGTAAYFSVFQTLSGNNASTVAEETYSNFAQGYGPYTGDSTHGAVGRLLLTNYLGPSGTTSGGGQPTIFEGGTFHTTTSNKYARPIFGHAEKELATAGTVTSITLAVGSSDNFVAEAKYVLYGYRES